MSFSPTRDFLISYKKTKGHEGFYSSGKGANAFDPGGETILGLTRAAEPESRVWVIAAKYSTLPNYPENMRNDPELYEAAQETYWLKYWVPMGCTAIDSQVLKNKLFDVGVNIGIWAVSTWLQFGLNKFNKRGTLWPDVTVDGDIGAKTTDALRAMLALRDGEQLIYDTLDGCQKVYYLVGKKGMKAVIEALKQVGDTEDWREDFEWGWHLNRTSSYEVAVQTAMEV